jgi:glyoxylase-like metal-dependent hydrolase (beta-lactamase superfamily II)
MPRRSERNPVSVSGDWYIDTRCIDCAASREVAPGLIVRREGKSVFAHQPATDEEERAAWRAALLCPTASVGTAGGSHVQPARLFPQELAPGVYRCGYNARSSFGAHSYLIRRKQGNVLVDSPRFTHKLIEAFEQLGGLSDILLTHRDDVADADRYARQFKARVWIHEHDREAASYATHVLRGSDPTEVGEGLLAIPVPGHTRGSVVYLSKSTYLFSGDSVAWDAELNDLTAFRGACWYSWDELKRSLVRLSSHAFEWVLPGHGHSMHLSARDMRERLQSLVNRM